MSLDIGFFPSQATDIRIFESASPTVSTNWQVWNKPRGKSMAFIFCIAGGGAGMPGVVGAASTAGGGGGGGSSGQSTLIVPVFLLPDVLYV